MVGIFDDIWEEVNGQQRKREIREEKEGNGKNFIFTILAVHDSRFNMS